ncbi:hypothetical protein [Pseudomonas sp. 4810-S13]|uniref:hypothetical protein n=1 Tax=Pseudomonas sp. 4810-S13 TaxID=3120822 RepID=UPI0031B6BBEC
MSNDVFHANSPARSTYVERLTLEICDRFNPMWLMDRLPGKPINDAWANAMVQPYASAASGLLGAVAVVRAESIEGEI